MKSFVLNKQAKYNYELLDKYEAGLVLEGHEVKAIKKGKMSLKGAYVSAKGNDIYLINSFISPYQPKNTPQDYNPSRPRKLLLNQREIRNLLGKLQQKGLTLVPVKVYNKNRRLKLEFALGKGKRKKDKREDIRKKEFRREIKGLY